jgi:hypothetical protein
MPLPAVIQLTSPGRMPWSEPSESLWIHPLAGLEVGRAHVVEEDERPDHPPLDEGQDAPDLEAAEVFAARLDHHLNHTNLPKTPERCIAGRLRARGRPGAPRRA